MYIEEVQSEQIAESTTYEKQRGKPIPSLHHGSIQAQISFLLKRDFPKKFQTLSEISLDFEPKGATPDLGIYPKMDFDYAKDEDILKMPDPPITTIEILSPKQAQEDLVFKIRNIYFVNGVKSAWVIFPSLKTVLLLLPGKKPEYFTSGKFTDPITDIELSVEEIFEV